MVRRPALQDRIAAGILETTAAVLAERGESVSMAEIAEAAGVGRATLYRYFPNRDALLSGLTRAGVEELCGRIAAAELETVPVREGIARLARGSLAAGSKYAVLARSAISKNADDMAALDEGVVQPTRALLRRGIDDGTLRADLPLDVQFEMFIGLLEKALQLVARDGLGVEQASATITTVFLDGMSRRGNAG